MPAWGLLCALEGPYGGGRLLHPRQGVKTLQLMQLHVFSQPDHLTHRKKGGNWLCLAFRLPHLTTLSPPAGRMGNGCIPPAACHNSLAPPPLRKNGNRLRTAFRLVKGELFPTVGLHRWGGGWGQLRGQLRECGHLVGLHSWEGKKTGKRVLRESPHAAYQPALQNGSVSDLRAPIATPIFPVQQGRDRESELRAGPVQIRRRGPRERGACLPGSRHREVSRQSHFATPLLVGDEPAVQAAAIER